MDRQDIVVIGLTNFQKMQEEDENAAEMYGVQPPPGVYRVVPPAPPQPKRTWDELVAINAQIRRGYLEAKG